MIDNRFDQYFPSLCAWGLLALLTLAPVGAQVGYSHRSGRLERFDLTADGSVIDVVLVGETGVSGISGAMAQHPDGTLYAAHYRWPLPYRLYRLDPETAEATLIGDLDLGTTSVLRSDMTFDNQGQLWLVGNGTLFLIDPATAEVSVIADGVSSVESLAYRGGVFYGIAGDPEISQWSLVAVDPATGGLTPIVDLTGIVSGSCHLAIPSASDFDVDGGLWVTVTSSTTCIDPPLAHTSIAYYADPVMGTVTSHSAIDSILWHPALAVDRPFRAIVEIPAVNTAGLLLLAAVLAAAGLFRLRS